VALAGEGPSQTDWHSGGHSQKVDLVCRRMDIRSGLQEDGHSFLRVRRVGVLLNLAIVPPSVTLGV
jgi:hypothetical protein